MIAASTANRVAAAIAGLPRAPQCGRVGVPELVVVLNTQLCLSCRAVGRFARQIENETPVAGGVLFVVPAGDAADVCEFLRRERVALPVVALPDSAIELPSDGTELVAFTVDGLGRPGRVWHGSEPMGLLRRIQRSLPPSLGRGRDHNKEGKQ
ncbi:MAG TPA: hypothetical protein VNL96_06505 [Gemmatimonadaceae bacterium]|nr:hypothetical protein [Gemmatimonadaceae bacterium]